MIRYNVHRWKSIRPLDGVKAALNDSIFST